MVISRQKTQQGITESAAIWYKTDDMKKKNRREKEAEQLHISNIEYSRQLMLKLVFILVSCLLIFIKNMPVTHLLVSRHFRAPGVVSIFNSSRENKYVFEIHCK